MKTKLKSWKELVEGARERTLEEEMIVKLVVSLSTHERYSRKTFQEIYDGIAKEARKVVEKDEN